MTVEIQNLNTSLSKDPNHKIIWSVFSSVIITV